MTIDARKAQEGGETAEDDAAARDARARPKQDGYRGRLGAPDVGDAIMLVAFLLILVCRDALGG